MPKTIPSVKAHFLGVKLISNCFFGGFGGTLRSRNNAQVVELVDTRGSGPRVRKNLQVQVLSWVPKKVRERKFSGFFFGTQDRA